MSASIMRCVFTLVDLIPRITNQLSNCADVIIGEKSASLNPIAAPYVHNGELNEVKMEEQEDEEISCISDNACYNKNKEEE